MVLVPPVVVAVTFTVPVPEGEIALIWLALVTLTFVEDVLPKWIEVPSVKLDPVIVTDVPPVVGPLEGLTPVTDGAAT